MTDSELLDWFEQEGAICGAALINDDNGHWAVSTTGHQEVCAGNEIPGLMATTFIVYREDWKSTVREAILAFKKEYERAGDANGS